MRLTDFSLRQPLFVVIFWILVLFFGLESFYKLPVSFMPVSKTVDVTITTVYPGADKRRVLEEVTKRVEKEVMQIRGVEDVTSTTQNERSVVSAHFKLGTVKETARAEMLIAANQAKILFPDGASDPVVKVLDPLSQTPLVTIAIQGELPQPEMYEFVDKSIRPSFEALDGVSHTVILGQRQKQAIVHLDLAKMQEREISATDVVSQLKKMGENGYIGQNSSYLIEGEFATLKDLGSVVIHYLSNDKVITLKDIADIREGLSDEESYCSINGAPCLILEVYSRAGAENLKIQRAYPKKIEQLQKRFPGISLHVLTNKTSSLTHLMFDFTKNSWIAIGVSIFLIWIVFKDRRSILISCSSIPTSLCGAFFVMDILGITINSYSVPAIIVSIGLIIDDMIVIRENIFRHLEEGLSPFEATRKGMEEMAKPVIGTSCMIFGVSLPMILLTGSETTQHLQNFGITMFVSMAFSLLEALTLGPVLCAYCLKSHKVGEVVHPIQVKISELYDKSLEFTKAHAGLILLAGGGLIVLGLMVAKRLPSENIPASSIGSLEMHLIMPRGVAFDKIKTQAIALSQQFASRYPDIDQIGFKVERDNEISFYIEMQEEKKRELTPDKLKTALEKEARLLSQLGEVDSYYVQAGVLRGAGYAWQYGLQLSGYDKEDLERYSKELFQAFQEFNGFNNLASSLQTKIEETSFLFDFKEMHRLGVLTSPAFQEIDILVNGREPTTFHPKDKTVAMRSEIKVKSNLPPTSTKELLAFSRVPNINQTLVPLKKIASEPLRDFSTPIRRKNGDALVEFTADDNKQVKHASLTGFTSAVIEEKLPLPKGIHLSWSRGSKALLEMKSVQGKLGLLALFFIYITLIILYESITVPLVLLLPLPMAVAGAFFSLFITGQSINTYSIIGIILSLGIAAKNGIILIDYTEQLIEQGLSPGEAVYTASRTRLRAILMTSFGVFLTTLPLIIVWDPYSKLQISLGIGLIGGLFTATLLSLYLIPIFFKYTHRFHLWAHGYLLRLFNEPPADYK